MAWRWRASAACSLPPAPPALSGPQPPSHPSTTNSHLSCSPPGAPAPFPWPLSILGPFPERSGSLLVHRRPCPLLLCSVSLCPLNLQDLGVYSSRALWPAVHLPPVCLAFAQEKCRKQPPEVRALLPTLGGTQACGQVWVSPHGSERVTEKQVPSWAMSGYLTSAVGHLCRGSGPKNETFLSRHFLREQAKSTSLKWRT